MDIEEIRDLADHVAALLPDAPADGDTINWLGWRELVWDAARRLGEIAGDALDAAGFSPIDDANTTHVSSKEILGLATLFRGQNQLQTGGHAV